MKTKKIAGLTILLIAAAAAALILAACDNSYGVFHEIQTEKAQVGTDIFKNATVKALGGDGSKYYAIMAKVYAKSTTPGSVWSVLSVSNDTDYYCSGFASDEAGTIYVASSDTASTALKGIYSTIDSGANWTKMDSGEFASKIVDALYYANGKLFVEAHTETDTAATYALYYYDTVSSTFLTAGLSGLDLPLKGLVWGDSAYWTITSSNVYTSATESGFTSTAESTSGTPSAAKTLAGIAVDSVGQVLVTTTDGYLYTRASSAWTNKLIASSVVLGVLAEVPIDSTPSGYRLMMAKHNASYGYYEYNATTSAVLQGNDSSAIFVPTASSYTTTIYTKPVLAIYYSATNDTILIGMAAQGTDTYALYSNTYSGTAWSGWTAE
ncbi:MAG: hypothetical protein WC820_07930 [Spirochaetales bacterium]|jgi:hypothetical protein